MTSSHALGTVGMCGRRRDALVQRVYATPPDVLKLVRRINAPR